LPQISETAGNATSVIDYEKIFLAQKGLWTLKSLGIELDERVSVKKSRRQVKK